MKASSSPTRSSIPRSTTIRSTFPPAPYATAFFKKSELNQVLTLSGDMNGAMMLNAGGPVEGEDQ